MQFVVTFQAFEGVVASIAQQGVGPGAAFEGIVTRGAHDGVGVRGWGIADGQLKVAAGAQPPGIGGRDAQLQRTGCAGVGCAAQGARSGIEHQPGGQVRARNEAGAVAQLVVGIGIAEGGLGDGQHQGHQLRGAGAWQWLGDAGRAVGGRWRGVGFAGIGNRLGKLCQGVAAPAPLHLEAAVQLNAVVLGVAQQPGAVAAAQLHVLEGAARELHGVVALAVGGRAHHACVVTGFKQVGVVAHAALQLVFAASAMQQVCASAAVQGVIPVCAPQLVVAFTAQQAVRSGAAIQGVRAIVARELVVSSVAQHKVVARFAIELVIARASVQHVFLGAAIHLVVACVAIHQILARVSLCHAQVIAVHGVVTLAAKQGVVPSLPSHPVGTLTAKQAVVPTVCSHALVGDQAHGGLELVVVLRGGCPGPVEGLARCNGHRVQAVVAGVHFDDVLFGMVPYEGLGGALGIRQRLRLGERCVMPVAQDQVVARTALGDVLSGAAKQRVALSGAVEGVVAQFATDPVAVFAAVGPGRFVGAVDVLTPELVVACAAQQHVAVFPAKGDVVVLVRGTAGVGAAADEILAITPHHHVIARKGHDVVAQTPASGDHVVKGAAVEAVALGTPAKGHALGGCCAVHGQVGNAVGVHHRGDAFGLLRGRADGEAVVAVFPALEIGHGAVLPCACVLGCQAPDAVFCLAQLVGLVGAVVNIPAHARHLGKGARDGFTAHLQGVGAAVYQGVYACEAGLQQVGVGIGPAFEVVCAVFAFQGVGAGAAVEVVFFAGAGKRVGFVVAEVEFFAVVIACCRGAQAQVDLACLIKETQVLRGFDGGVGVIFRIAFCQPAQHGRTILNPLVSQLSGLCPGIVAIELFTFVVRVVIGAFYRKRVQIFKGIAIGDAFGIVLAGF